MSDQKRKYFFYAIEYSMGNERFGPNYFDREDAMYTVLRAVSRENVERAIHRNDDIFGPGPFHYTGRIEEFGSKKEAMQKVREWYRENEEYKKSQEEQAEEFWENRRMRHETV